MNRCPITYASISEGERYSSAGLKKLSPKLTKLNDLPFTAEEQRIEALQRADKMSIQGIQPKLSAILSVKESQFQIVDSEGHYILKPQHAIYLEAPENEDLTMRLAAMVGIEVPLHGLVYSEDGSLTYFIKRFDRIKHKDKLSVEDFAQLSLMDRETKYRSSMEKLVPIIERYCTFPLIEKVKLFTRTVVNYLLGNEDMHLKNFSLITRDEKIELSPAYDFINSTIALRNPKEELALTLNGKKRNFSRKHFVEYYAYERLGLNKKLAQKELDLIEERIDDWKQLVSVSFLSNQMKESYLDVLESRLKIIF